MPAKPTKPTLAGLLVLLAACAGAPAGSDGQAVTLIERNKEGEEHLALPTELPGCEHKGMTRVSIPEGAAGLPPEVLDTLKQKAARMGGNTLVLLPGRRVGPSGLRGSVFKCETPPVP